VTSEAGAEADTGGPGDAGEAGEAEATSETGAASEAGAVDAAVACDPSGDPSTQPCALTSAGGVFVSAAGSDANDGTKELPFATIGYAVAHLHGLSRVFVCGGTYREQVTLQVPVSLYGGFACTAGWTWQAALTKVLSPSADYALSVAGLGMTSPVTIQDLTLVTPVAQSALDGGAGIGAAVNDSGVGTSGAGLSSIAAIVANSAVKFTRVTFTPGAGGDGANGQPGSAAPNYTVDPVPVPTTFEAPTNLCRYPGPSFPSNEIDSSTGGFAQGNGPTADDNGTSNPLVPAAFMTARHDGHTAYGLTTPGDPGADGPPRPAASDPQVYGSLVAGSPLGWTPTVGGNGPAGQPGQGGGGGSADPPDTDLTSGTGGAGGCGGSGGTGGQGGGASIALLAWSSQLTFAACTVQPSAGGTVGKAATRRPAKRARRA
jgi:hypothetical protein